MDTSEQEGGWMLFHCLERGKLEGMDTLVSGVWVCLAERRVPVLGAMVVLGWDAGALRGVICVLWPERKGNRV
ncbi:hypothetical protein [Bartonella koehlerae]|uniref:hypothetical protein n=1 Tax=Bartonella koehlerae TaxID=92181 RepID=UPI000A06EAF1|nr:hypothetical protein [Bartonella koehlerae]